MRQWHANLVLLFAAFIWGSTFVAQQMAMAYLGPLTINGLRFLIGTFCLLPLVFWEYQSGLKQKTVLKTATGDRESAPYRYLIWRMIWIGAIPGFSMACAAFFQQAGLLDTNVANAGFLTSINVAFVPVWGFLLFRQIPSFILVCAVFVSIGGAYFLTGGLDFSSGLNSGDLYVLISAVFWALNYQLLVWAQQHKLGVIAIACGQFFCVGTSSLFLALLLEDIPYEGIVAALGPLLFAGVLSVAIAFTLQVWALKYTSASQASLILSLEAVFAAVAGWVVLQESLSQMQVLGGGLIMIAVLLSESGDVIRRNMARRRKRA